ncbi:glycoside hydrolase family 16 protein [Hymenobacter sp. B1770]|uniref:glycoside hydrolase family 16 protein n=1 Tax=Hymenobacter sp. B1770 TaxID=1718788 RepID=UPI003CF66907
MKRLSKPLLGLFHIAALAGCSLSQAPVLLSQPNNPATGASQSVSSSICNYNQPASRKAELLSAGWEKRLEDNFDSNPTSTSNSLWSVWVGGAFNNELQLYTANATNLSVIPDSDNAANSVLSIRAVKETVVGPKYRQDVDATPTTFEFTSARIESKTLFAPGRGTSQLRFAARIKLPSGYGMWPAFWSYGNNWPTDGEIDVLEARGNEPFLFQTNYFFGRQPNVNLVQNAAAYLTTSTSLTDCWHVYEVLWTKQSLTFLLDGQVVDVKTGGYVPDLYGRPERLSLNLAVGGDFFYKDGARPTPGQILLNEGEGQMLVDWVQVYSKK